MEGFAWWASCAAGRCCKIQNVRASQVVLDSERDPVFSYPTVHTQQSSVPNGVAEHNVTVARAFTKLMGAFVTFWDNDAGLLGQLGAGLGAARQEDSLLESQMLQYLTTP